MSEIDVQEIRENLIRYHREQLRDCIRLMKELMEHIAYHDRFLSRMEEQDMEEATHE